MVYVCFWFGRHSNFYIVFANHSRELLVNTVDSVGGFLPLLQRFWVLEQTAVKDMIENCDSSVKMISQNLPFFEGGVINFLQLHLACDAKAN